MRTDRLRALSLTHVLQQSDAQQDAHDARKWHTSQGVVSVNGTKFYNWQSERGGGGAIDLACHLRQCGFAEALDWLNRLTGNLSKHLQNRDQEAGHANTRLTDLRLPLPDPSRLEQVSNYLVGHRGLEASRIAEHITNGSLYADARGNAVFVLFGASKQATGAELRGSHAKLAWRGMARGTRKDRGYFSSNIEGSDREPVILCESAIDAISCSMLHQGVQSISAAGARANPAWLKRLIEQGRRVYCGYDADSAGDRAAQAMIARHSEIKRLRPARKDWNEQLTAS